MTTSTAVKNSLAVVAVAVAAIATLTLVAQIARPTETRAGAAVVTQSDGSFDRAEYQRHLSVIEHRADGFDEAEQARFDRIETKAPSTTGPTGFERAEAKRHHRLEAAQGHDD